MNANKHYLDILNILNETAVCNKASIMGTINMDS